MKKLVFLFCLMPAVATAATLVPDRLPHSAHVDTEVTTNCPFSFIAEQAKEFRFEMAFAGTSSNNVQLAFGCDADTNGVLSAAETGLVFAWDCGKWVLSGNSEGTWSNRFETASVTTNIQKEFSWKLGFRRRVPRTLTLTENGEALFPEFAESPYPWFHDGAWNLFRVTVRGVDAPDETVSVTMDYRGVTIIVR